MERRLSRRGEQTPPFLAMDVLERARVLEAAGRSVVHLEVGDPDFATPDPVVEAASRAVAEGRTHYTESPGIPALREAIARRYLSRYGVRVDPSQVFVSAGSSPLMLMLAMALLDPGDEVIVPDPGYSCYANFVRAADGIPVRADAGRTSGYRLTPAAVDSALSPRSRALILNSPANPTGTVYTETELADLVALAERHGLWVISDEIYHALGQSGVEPTALRFSDRAIVVDSFSKRYAMTGWRLGWGVVPKELFRPLQKLQQNLLVCAPSVSQYAALAAIEHGEPYVARMAAEYARRRRLLLEGLRRIGLPIAGQPEGAFYVLVDAAHVSSDSTALAFEILENAGVALTPGVDFGPRGEGHLRLSYARADAAEEGLRRLSAYLGARSPA